MSRRLKTKKIPAIPIISNNYVKKLASEDSYKAKEDYKEFRDLVLLKNRDLFVKSNVITYTELDDVEKEYSNLFNNIKSKNPDKFHLELSLLERFFPPFIQNGKKIKLYSKCVELLDEKLSINSIVQSHTFLEQHNNLLLNNEDNNLYKLVYFESNNLRGLLSNEELGLGFNNIKTSGKLDGLIRSI